MPKGITVEAFIGEGSHVPLLQGNICQMLPNKPEAGFAGSAGAAAQT